MKKKNNSRKAGLPPGTLVYTGSNNIDTTISMIVYDDQNFNYYKNITFEKVIQLQGENTTNWLLINGFKNIEEIQKIANHFKIHPLVLEDIFNVEHLPKIEDNDNSLFITLKNLAWTDKPFKIESEQISMYLTNNMLITFEEKAESIFTPIINRIQVAKGKARIKQEDFLCYLLIDQIVDNYYILLEQTEEEIENLESIMLNDSGKNLTSDFLQLKKILLQLRKVIYPLREIIRYISRGNSNLISESTFQYLGDISDHLMFITQSIDNFRDMISSMLDLMMANYSNQMNSIMKTLTLVSTIFIPMTLLSSIFGMNFKYMPELSWRYGYLFFWILLLCIGVGMFVYMKRKRWF